MAASDQDRGDHGDATKPGPPNPQGSDMDAPTPPGGPLRSDAPSGSTTPGGPGTPAQPGRPQSGTRPMRPVEEPVASPTKEATVPDDPDTLSRSQPSDDAGEH